MTPPLDTPAIIAIVLAAAFILALPVIRYWRILHAPQHDAGDGRDGEWAEDAVSHGRESGR